MGQKIVQSQNRSVWALVRRQHGVISRRQLLVLGINSDAIQHRIESGRLHPIWPGVYAVGRPGVSRQGRWMAAVLACGPGAALSHSSAGSALRICDEGPQIEVSLPAVARPRCPGITVHRRTGLVPSMLASVGGIPVTDVVCTIVDLAARLSKDELEAVVNEADKRELVDPERLRSALDAYAGRPGVSRVRDTLDRRTFTLADSQLERLFLPIARAVGLDKPLTGSYVNGFKVDFYWPELGLVVETDGLRYHRTPAQQARDRMRDQAHTRAGLTPLRFTRAQVRYERDYVEETLGAVASRLRASKLLSAGTTST